MTWTPRNRSEDEEEEENIDLEKNDEEDPQKLEEKGDPEATETGRERSRRGGGAGWEALLRPGVFSADPRSLVLRRTRRPLRRETWTHRRGI